MPRPGLRDRFFTAPVARAILSPLGILAAGAGTTVGILANLPVAAAVALGVAAWGGRVAMAVPRASGRPRIDPFTLNDPWRRFVQKALQARARFDEAVGNARSGPLRDRLGEIGERVDAAVRECWQIANRGQELADARRQIDAGDAEGKLAELEAVTGTADPGARANPASPAAASPAAASAAAESTAAALLAQLATASRLDVTISETRARLQLLDARLNEAAARSIELSVRAGGLAALAGLGADVDSLVGDMEALRQGLEEVGGSPAPEG